MLNPNSKGLALLFASRGIVLYDAVAENSVDPQSAGYTVDLSSSVFHLPICPELHNIPSESQVTFTGTVDYLLSNGYMPCSTCILQTDSIQEGAMGSSVVDGVEPTFMPAPAEAAVHSYVLNTNSKKFHLLSCSSVDEISAKNYSTFSGTRDSLIKMGYQPCKICNP